MQLTQIVKDFTAHCNVDIAKLSELEQVGMAAVLFSRLRECVSRATDELVLKNVCFGEGWVDDLACMLWWRLDEATDNDVVTLMSDRINMEFGALNRAAYEFLATGPNVHPAELDVEKAKSRYAYYGNNTEWSDDVQRKQLAETLHTHAAGLLPSFSLNQAVDALKRYPDIRDKAELLRRLPEVLSSLEGLQG